MVWTLDSKTEMLATWAMLCVGAIAVTTTNIAVELRVTNGTKVIIREVVSHPNDKHGGWDQMQNWVVRLSQPPICIFVKLTEANEWSREFRQGEPRWFPIMRQNERVKLSRDSGAARSFLRTQISLIRVLVVRSAITKFRARSSGTQYWICTDLPLEVSKLKTFMSCYHGLRIGKMWKF
jgi:hypothetical protein